VSAWALQRAWEGLRRRDIAGAADVYADALNRCPVARVDELYGGFWAVMGQAELVRAAHATDVFSNVVPLFATRRPPLECDPPEHRFYRRMLNPFFSRERMAAMEPEVRACAVEMLMPLIDAREGDFAASFSHPFPTRVLCVLLGLPDEDWKMLNDWSVAVDRRGGHSAPGDPERHAAGEELRPYMHALVEERRQRPGNDIVSGIVHGDPDLPALEDEAIVGIVMMLLSAGHNTTTSAIGNLVLRLAEDRELQERLRADPELIPAAVEESIRIDAPQQAMRRVAKTDTEIGGQKMAAGDWVWLVFGAANVDAEAVECPAEFRLDRGANRHHGFGRGIHLCIGAPLARLQVRVVVDELLARTSVIELNGSVTRPEWPRLGVSSLPLTLR
jgi:cytochrome P450